MSKTVRYLAGGVVIGGFWYLNRSRPPWEEALRTIILFGVMMYLVKARLKRSPIDVRLVPLVASKGALVILGAVAEYHLRQSSSAVDPALLVALGLAVGVILVGLVGDRFFFVRRTPPSTAQPAAWV